MGLDISKAYTKVGAVYDFLEKTDHFDVEGTGIKIELDYQWDFSTDPIITPTIINEWNFLNNLMGKKVLENAPIVLSIGGGGTSQTHQYLNEETREFYIINPGFWDLQNAKMPADHIETTLIRAIAEDLPLTDESIDAIEIPATIDHLVNPYLAITECFRVLKQGGRIGITLGNRNSWYREIVRALRIGVEDNHEHHHNFHLSPSEIEDLLKDNGFEDIETIGTAFLKLPKGIERVIKTRFWLRIHEIISNTVLRHLFGDSRGGMFITHAVKL